MARKIGTTRLSISGFYPFKGNGPVAFESILEQDFLIRTEFSMHVLDVISQPVQIPFCLDGRWYDYTPDYLVYYRLGSRVPEDYPKPLLVEVKPIDVWKRNWRKWTTKWKAAREYARKEGMEFRLFDETRIRDAAFENIRFLERYKRADFDEEDSADVIQTVQRMGTVPFHYLLNRHFMGHYRATGITHIWHLIAMRRLDCDISRPLNENTELWIPTYE